uniref:Uncharacterized protein n=1 Tax=Cyprinus carpio TaxID=7962 RepID=A0A8C2FEW9_CYPCA
LSMCFVFVIRCTGLNGLTSFFISVQNGSLHQKETVHDNDFEPYLTGQSN